MPIETPYQELNTPPSTVARPVSAEPHHEGLKKGPGLKPSHLFRGDSKQSSSRASTLELPSPTQLRSAQGLSGEADIPSAIKKQVEDIERELMDQWSVEGLLNPISPGILSFFKVAKVEMDEVFLTQLDCCTLQCIKDFCNNPLNEISAMFSSQDLQNEEIMDKVAALLTFGKALDSVWEFRTLGEEDLEFLRDYGRELWGYYRSIYMKIRRQWHEQVSSDIDSYTATSQMNRRRMKTGSRKSHGGSQSKGSLHSGGSTIASKKSTGVPQKIEIDALTPISMTETQAKRAFLGKTDGKMEKAVSIASSKGRRDTSSGFMSRLKDKYVTMNQQPKEIKRPPLPARVTWDGDFQTFDSFRNKLEGHYRQTGAGYLFNKELQKCYLKTGASCAENFPDDVPSAFQLKQDNCSLFGALQCACQEGVGKTILLEYEDGQDGIRAWLVMCDKYAADGNKDVRISRLEKVISTKYSKGYRGGLLQWIQDYENAFAELITLKERQWKFDPPKKRRILQNSVDSGLDPTLLQQITKEHTFSEVCNLLCTHAISTDVAAKENAARKVHVTKSNTAEVMQAMIHLLTQPKDSNTNASSDFNLDDLAANANLIKSMPMELWETIPTEVKSWIRKERTRLYDEDKKKHGDKKSEDHKSSTMKQPADSSLPRQYSKANLMTSEGAHEVLNAFLARQSAAESGEDSDEEDFLISSACSTITTSYVGITDARATAIKNLLTLSDGNHISISDNGADTCVLGKGWHIVATHPTRRAHVIGFDKQYAQKCNLPIVSGVTVVDLPEGPILLQANESIGNMFSDHTLLSEFQMREFGVDVDSKSKRHGGKQRFQVPNSGGDDAIIPLCLTRALLHMKHREPTDEELATLKPIHITQGEVPWKPGNYNDDLSKELFDNVQKLGDEDDNDKEATAPKVHQDGEQADNEEKDGISNLEDVAWYLGEMTTHQCNNSFMEERMRLYLQSRFQMLRKRRLNEMISKRQKTVETLTYRSELMAAEVATELILETRYLLRCLGVPVEGPALIFGNNMSVVLNTTVPSSVLKNKHCSISNHRVEEATTARIPRFAHISSTENISDVMTKPLSGIAFHNLIQKLLFRKPSSLEEATRPI